MAWTPEMSLAQTITRHFGGEWHGTYGAFAAPGHSKGDRGMTVKDEAGAPDGVLINTFNGADPLAIKDDLRDAGILPPRGQANDNQARETGAYEYVDRDGVVLYRTVRIEQPGQKKRFVAQLPDGRGGWKSGKLDGVPRVLYRLTDFRAAISTASLKDEPMPTIYLVEGERKADKLASWGLFATSCAFGCKGWRKSYAEDLAGCTVIILPDNDDEGRAFAERAAQDITACRGTAHIVELPDLPAKGDIIDWTGTADDLAKLVEAAVNPGGDKTFPLIDIASWEGVHAPAREWTLDEWIPARQATYLTGPGSAGKSLLSQQLSTCTALGLPFMGIETRQAVSIYITCEDDEDELHRRQKAICESLGVGIGELAGRLHLVSLAGALGNELATFDINGRMVVSPAYRMLQNTCRSIGAGFITLDNVAHLFAGNENIRNQVAAFCGLLNKLAAETGGSVLFLGHPNKAGDSFSGSTAWENQVRSRLFLETPKVEGEICDPDVRTLSRGKANYARNGVALSFRWHQWAFVRQEDLPPDQASEIAANMKAASVNAKFLQCLAKATDEKRNTSTSASASNYAPKMFAGMTIGKGISKRDFAEAMERLLHLGTIANHVPIFQRDNRAWVHGLGLSDSAPTLAPTPAPSEAQTCTDLSDNALKEGE
jgi:RecA-family ATPase